MRPTLESLITIYVETVRRRIELEQKGDVLNELPRLRAKTEQAYQAMQERAHEVSVHPIALAFEVDRRLAED